MKIRVGEKYVCKNRPDILYVEIVSTPPGHMVYHGNVHYANGAGIGYRDFAEDGTPVYTFTPDHDIRLVAKYEEGPPQSAPICRCHKDNFRWGGIGCVCGAIKKNVAKTDS